VRPFFRALVRRDPQGLTWLPKLLALAPRHKSYPHPKLLAHPGCIRKIQPTLVNDTEKALVPPEAFLRWLLLHPESMTWPKKGRAVFGADAQHWRERLMQLRDLTGEPHERRKRIREADREHAVHEALEQLERVSAARCRGHWWAFEGFTSVDFYFETDHLRIYLEGKRTEALSPSTDWYPGRNQLLRNLESAQTDAGGAPFVCLVLAEEPLPEMDSTTVDASLPHLEPAARQILLRHYLGTITWRQACAATGFDYEALPDAV
jgi:hypothetical protein